MLFFVSHCLWTSGYSSLMFDVESAAVTEALTSVNAMRGRFRRQAEEIGPETPKHRGRPQAWARGSTCPLWKCCEVFYALVQ